MDVFPATELRRFSLPARPSPAVQSCFALVAWCLLLFLYGATTSALSRTEPLRALVAREMADSGNWLVPVLYGEPFLTKPPGMYVAIRLCSLPFGEVTELSARLPSFFAATLTLLMFFATLRQLLPLRTAFVIVLILPMSVVWLDKAPSAEIDMLQLFWVSAAILAFRQIEISSRPGGWWLLACLAVTGGFLTKWTAPAFFVLTIIPYLALRKKLTSLLTAGPLAGLALSGILILGWVLLVSREVGFDVLRETVLKEATQRFDPNRKAGGYPIGESLLFPWVVLATHLPLSGLMLWSFRRRFGQFPDDSGRSFHLLLHCWIWPNLLFWSLTPQHVVRYIVPLTPAICLLGALVVRNVSTKWLSILVLGWVLVKVGYSDVVIPGRTIHRSARETAKQVTALVPEGVVLHIRLLKEEGVLFYADRPVRKLPSTFEQPILMLTTEQEWQEMKVQEGIEKLATFADQQKAPFHLVRLQPNGNLR